MGLDFEIGRGITWQQLADGDGRGGDSIRGWDGRRVFQTSFHHLFLLQRQRDTIDDRQATDSIGIWEARPSRVHALTLCFCTRAPLDFCGVLSCRLVAGLGRHEDSSTLWLAGPVASESESVFSSPADDYKQSAGHVLSPINPLIPLYRVGLVGLWL